MKILITGCAGFIGSNLAETLVETGHDVIGIDNFNPYYDISLKRLNAKQLTEKGVIIFEKDLNDDLSFLPKDIDIVYHFAAQPGISNTTKLKEYIDNNIYATDNLLSFFIDNNIELKCFINIATSSIYGKYAASSEDKLPAPISNYGTTKLAAENLVLAAQQKGLLKTCSLRLYSVYGPRERPEKLYTKLIEAIYKNKKFPLYKGSLTHSRSFTYVGDIVQGMLNCINNIDKINGEIINLGSDIEYTTKDGIELIEKIIGKKVDIQEMPPRDGDQLKTTAVIDKARKLLNYEPKTNFEDGLRKQVQWYHKNFVK